MNDITLKEAINEASGASTPKRITATEKKDVMFKDLDLTTFREVSSRIDAITKDINPSGTNGRMGQWVSSVNGLFSKMGIAPESYIQTYWKLNGSKKD